MSYAEFEQSKDKGMPILLLEFVNSRFGTLYYTNSMTAVTVGGHTYQPCGVRVSHVKATKDVQTSEVTLSFPRNHELPEELRSPYSSHKTSVLIRRAHKQEPANSLVYWRGRAVNVTTKADTADVLCESMNTIAKRIGNSPKFQKLCRHGLYSPMCGLSYSAWREAGLVTNVISAFSLRVDAAGEKANGYYKGGVLDVSGALSFIVSHVGTRINVLAPMDNVEVGDTVHIAPGCSLSVAVCHSKFDNLLRHGGFPLTPAISPFNGTNIYTVG